MRRAEMAGSRGAVIFEFDGTKVRRDCVLVQHSAVATVFIGLGRRALVALADPRRRDTALLKRMAKASDEDPLHPGWPAGTPGGRGGKFRPKNEDAADGGATPNREVAPKDGASQTEAPPKSQPIPHELPPLRYDLAPVGEASPEGGVPVGSNTPSLAEAPEKTAARRAGVVAIKRLALRRAIRALTMQALKTVVEVAANAVPFLGEAADVLLVHQLAETFADFYQLSIDAQAATDFVENGPYRLEDLQVSPDNESFSSYAEFYKGFLDQEDLEKRFGRAGDGQQYHHIVEQGGANAAAIPAEKLQSTENIIRLPTLMHQAVSAEYSEMSEEIPGLTVRQWLKTLPYERQREEGIKILERLGIVRSSSPVNPWPSNH